MTTISLEGQVAVVTGGSRGIGLAIAQRAVQQHGGVISASNAKDGGLVVEIVLPRTKKAE